MSDKITELKAALATAKEDQGKAQELVQKADANTPEKASAQTALQKANDAVKSAEEALVSEEKAMTENAAQKKTTTNNNAGSGAKAKKPKKAEKGEVVLISCKQPRRRAGMKFGPEPLQVDLGDLSPEQRKALYQDKSLKIEKAEG